MDMTFHISLYYIDIHYYQLATSNSSALQVLYLTFSQPTSHRLAFLLQRFLVVTHHGHLEVTGCQDVKNAIVLALAPMLTRSLSRNNFIN
jgi:hypothetical protein